MAVDSIDISLNQPAELTRGAYPIPLTSPTTAGFLGRTERGPINEPVCVESFPEYCRYFGGHLSGGAVSAAVQDYFLHGGRRAVIVRVANRAARAKIDVPAGDDMLRLEARYPGRHEALRVSIDYERTQDDDDRFNLVVQRLSSNGARLVEDQEIYPLVSVRRSDPRFVGDVVSDSRLITIAGAIPERRPDATPPERPGASVRYIGLTSPGDDGVELTDYDVIGSDRDGTGLFAFARGPRIDLLAIPLPADKELGTTAFIAASRYCEHHRSLLIWDPPLAWQSADSAMLGARRLNFANGNVLTYFPRVRPRGAGARFAAGITASGAIAGMLAQRDRGGIWAARGDYALRPALTPVVGVSDAEAKALIRYGINAFVPRGGGAAKLVGGVTLGAAGFGPSFSLSLDRRRLAFFILNSIEDAAAAAVAADDPRAALLRCEWQCRRFFDELFEHGALKGKTPAQAYYLQTRHAADETAG
ncbi:MAG: hypothetical protein R3305_02305, partial [Gammaproteobacteria bacterium]|nr:hypothetical protein [Gammaproteobacteria bacterium]